MHIKVTGNGAAAGRDLRGLEQFSRMCGVLGAPCPIPFAFFAKRVGDKPISAKLRRKDP